MEKIVITEQQYETAEECWFICSNMFDAVRMFMEIYNMDYDISYRIMNAVVNHYSYLEVEEWKK